MTARQFIIGMLICWGAANLAHSADTTALSAADFSKRAYRGFTLDNIFLASASEKDFDDMAEMHVNLVRTGIALTRCENCKAYAILPATLAAVDRIVAMAAKRHMYVILTLEPEKPEEGKYWNDTELQRSIIDTWVKLTERYKGNPGMGGFDLINEPNPPGSWREASRQYANFAGRIIQALRAVDTKRMIVYEPAPRGHTFYAFKPILDNPLPYSNVVYSTHFYPPMEITSQGIGQLPRGQVYPSAEWNKAKLSERLDTIRQFLRKYNLPFYIGEFSCTRFAPESTRSRWIKDAIDLFEAEGWSWTFHSFRGWDGYDPELTSYAPRAHTRKDADRQRAETPAISLLREYLDKNQLTK